jgi:CheY-like chemotaxis protein
MMMKQPHFIIVDDDPTNNFITKRVIKKISPHADVITFTDPEEGLDCILSTIVKPNSGEAILLLDINMPTMTGWQFIEHLEQESTVFSERLLIYILSSSVDSADKERAKANPHIIDYIMKPLRAEAVIHLLE